MNKKVLIFGLIAILSLLVYNYMYQDHRNIAKENADYSLGVSQISNEFIKNQSIAEKQYIDKTLIINGLISEINKKNVTLEGAIFCSFVGEIPNGLKEKLKIKIKGRCIGYDDLLQQVKLDQCIIVN